MPERLTQAEEESEQSSPSSKKSAVGAHKKIEMIIFAANRSI